MHEPPYPILPRYHNRDVLTRQLALPTESGTYDLLDLTSGELTAHSVPIPGNGDGPVMRYGNTEAWWYRLADDGTGERLIAIETSTLQQVDTGIRVSAGAEIADVADDRLLIVDHKDDRVVVVSP